LGVSNAKDPENDCNEKQPPPDDLRVTRKTPSFSLLSDRDSLEDLDEDPESNWGGIDI
jgi:hypothetical protein